KKTRRVVALFIFFILFSGLGFISPESGFPCTLSSATVSWASDDGGEIYINGNLVNICPAGCWVGVNNISIPTAWLNPTGDNVLAAYSYSSDAIYSGTTWLLTLAYSDCADTYVESGDPCVLDQYL